MVRVHKLLRGANLQGEEKQSAHLFPFSLRSEQSVQLTWLPFR